MLANWQEKAYILIGQSGELPFTRFAGTSIPPGCLDMYILYIDDSGSARNPNEKHFILAGIVLFERQIYHFNKVLDQIVDGTGLPEPEKLELHANAIFAGRKKWRALGPIATRRKLILDALMLYTSLQGRNPLFGVAVEKAAIPDRDPVEYAFAQLCSRFDQFLGRQRHDGQDQRGMIVMDKSTRETRLQSLSAEFRTEGHPWGRTRWIADVPFFVDSRATRIVQYADLVAYAMWRKFEKGDGEFFDVIRNRFDASGGVVHGLHHERYANSTCDCPYCATRRADT